MFFEFLQAVATLDLNWLAWLLFSNLHYLFLFGVLCFFFWGPSVRKAAIATIILSITAWIWYDFQTFSGWAWALPVFLGIYYITKVGVVAFAEDMPQLKKHLVLVQEIHFVGLFVVFNLFMV